MPIEKIQEDFALLNNIILQNSNTYLNHYETIKLLYPVYITRSPDIEYIKAYNATYNFRLERRENSCEVVVMNADGYNGDAILSIRQEDIGETIILFLKHLSFSANLSALRLD